MGYKLYLEIYCQIDTFNIEKWMDGGWNRRRLYRVLVFVLEVLNLQLLSRGFSYGLLNPLTPKNL
jgi:hypothetical protein